MTAMKLLFAAALFAAPSAALGASSTGVDHSSGTVRSSSYGHGSGGHGIGANIHPTAITSGHFSRGLAAPVVLRRFPIATPVKPVQPLPPIKACPMLACGVAPAGAGCTYGPAPVDANGCGGCRPLICSITDPVKPVACPEFVCAIPRLGCHYGPAVRESNGCTSGCGPLICTAGGSLGSAN